MRARGWALIGLAALCSVRDDDLRIATFNIEMFPQPTTDPARVAAVISELDADVIALQEIRDPDALRGVLAQASTATDRDYRFVLSPCGALGGWITTGLVWDADRVTLLDERTYPELAPDGVGSCSGSQPGVLGVFDDDGDRFAVLSMHFLALPERFEQRKAQWQRALAIMAAVEAELGVTVIALGDTNSTGYSGEPAQERRFVEDVVAHAGYELPSADIDCTEYWRPAGAASFRPSVLDHVVATDGRWRGARAYGMCARMRCQSVAADRMDRDYTSVSDHCPVAIDGRP